MSAQFSRSHVSSHSDPTDLWIIIEKEVFDVTKFQAEHPGGEEILRSVAGKDATKKFNKYHNPKILGKYKEELKVGMLAEGKDEKERKIEKEKKNEKEMKDEKIDKGSKFKFLKWKKS